MDVELIHSVVQQTTQYKQWTDNSMITELLVHR